MKDANLYDIARDDALLDALGSRRTPDRGEELFAEDPFLTEFAAWAVAIDRQAEESAEAPEGMGLSGLTARTGSSPVVLPAGGAYSATRPRRGRHAKRGTLATAGRHSVRAGAAVTVVGAALSLSGVAAAVNGGHLPKLPSFGISASAGSAGRSVLADVPSATGTDAPVRPTDRPQPAAGGAAGVHGETHGTAAAPASQDPTASGTDAPTSKTETRHDTAPSQAEGHAPTTAESASAPAEGRSDRSSPSRSASNETRRVTRPATSEPSSRPGTSSTRSTTRPSSSAQRPHSPSRPPSAPARPTTPSKPSKPTRPTTPSAPSKPSTPSKPSAPSTSGKPSAPTTSPSAPPTSSATGTSAPGASSTPGEKSSPHGGKQGAASQRGVGHQPSRVGRGAVRKALTTMSAPLTALASEITDLTSGS